MLTRTVLLENPQSPKHLDALLYKKDALLFFDIETTGFMADASSLYLIGCCFYSNETWQLVQWFADDYESEKKILSNFIECTRNHPLLIQYNGESFDIKYLRQKAISYGIDFPEIIKQKDYYSGAAYDNAKYDNAKNESENPAAIPPRCLSIDLYQHMKRLKKLCRLKALKLKDAELLLGIKREDPFSGGELLKTYCNYMKLKILSPGHSPYDEKTCTEGKNHALLDFDSQKSYSDYDPYEFYHPLKGKSQETLLEEMLLHNYEDVLSLIPLFDITRTTELLFYPSYLWDAKKLSACLCWEENENEKILRGKDFCFPVKDTLLFPLSKDSAEPAESPHMEVLKICPCGFSLSTKSFLGKLKLFYPDYRNYFYLPLEDYAVHKSIGEYLDRSRCQKAKPYNAYTCHEGEYIKLIERKNAPAYILKQHRIPFPVLFEDYYSSCGYVRFLDLKEPVKTLSWLKYKIDIM